MSKPHLQENGDANGDHEYCDVEDQNTISPPATNGKEEEEKEGDQGSEKENSEGDNKDQQNLPPEQGRLGE